MEKTDAGLLAIEPAGLVAEKGGHIALATEDCRRLLQAEAQALQVVNMAKSGRLESKDSSLLKMR